VVAFAYPKTRHQRTQKPGPFSTYQKYKPALRLEFEDRCVYCRTPAPSRGIDQFGVDHYRPQQLFPDLATEYANLYYCCNTCNRWKGPYWPNAAFEATDFIPNPCDHVMFQHIHARPDGTIVPKTRAGAVMVSLLHLNDEMSIRWRFTTSHIIETLRGQEAQLIKKLGAVAKKLRTKELSEEVAARATGLFTEQLDKARSCLAMYCEPPQA
jgi:hypothetical protein